jgi:hypothetical protein
MKTAFVATLLLSLWLGWGQRVYADPIGEEEFWSLLAQTEAILSDPADSDRISALRTQWQAIDSVRLEGREILLDVRWISEGLDTSSEGDIAVLQRQMSALLAYHSRGSYSLSGTGASLDALETVLQDARFQYPEVTPTPAPTHVPSVELEPMEVTGGSSVSQLILLVVGAIILAAVVTYFARTIAIQTTTLQTEADDDPNTSHDAQQRAENHEAARDYRSAIRYLYLASLLLLDERGLIHYDRTLTNREHLRQVSSNTSLFELLRSIINLFEDVWYGFAPVDEEGYRDYCQAIDHLRRLV